MLGAWLGCTGAKQAEVAPSELLTPTPRSTPRGVVLVIGDGMGLAQLSAADHALQMPLAVADFDHVGLQRTGSSTHAVTDSAASATAMASGQRTKNGAVGVDADDQPLTSVLHLAEAKGLSTGVVATSTLTHATPAAFVAHHPVRYEEQAIAADFLDVQLEVAIGGGRTHFDEREDGRVLTDELSKAGVTVVNGIDAITTVDAPPLYGFLGGKDPGKAGEGREGQLHRAAVHAFDLLAANEAGFFLMVEGSQVDWAGHANDATWLLEEMADLNLAVDGLQQRAAARGDVLMVVTADHETGGLSLLPAEGDPQGTRLTFATDGHSAAMVPVFATGPGSEAFSGIYDNTEIAERIAAALGLELP